jgi:uncharacterized membrane protein
MFEPGMKPRWLTLTALVGLAFIACSGATETPDAGRADDGGLGSNTGDGGPIACTVMAPTSCPAPSPRWADVAPIFQRRCVACHTGTPGGPWPLRTYEHVADWADFIRADLLSCAMPPVETERVSPMPLEERLTILTWIRCGFPR